MRNYLLSQDLMEDIQAQLHYLIKENRIKDDEHWRGDCNSLSAISTKLAYIPVADTDKTKDNHVLFKMKYSDIDAISRYLFIAAKKADDKELKALAWELDQNIKAGIESYE